MNETENLRTDNLSQLTHELNRLVDFFEKGRDYERMVYPLWNAKDILGHLTFWHESFARNLSDVANGIQPHPLKGKLSEVNESSVETTKLVPIKSLIERLSVAQRIIEQYIFMSSITQIPYKKGARDYSPEEHLEIVSHHIRKHMNDLDKVYQTEIR